MAEMHQSPCPWSPNICKTIAIVRLVLKAWGNDVTHCHSPGIAYDGSRDQAPQKEDAWTLWATYQAPKEAVPRRRAPPDFLIGKGPKRRILRLLSTLTASTTPMYLNEGPYPLYLRVFEVSQGVVRGPFCCPASSSRNLHYPQSGCRATLSGVGSLPPLFQRQAFQFTGLA